MTDQEPTAAPVAVKRRSEYGVRSGALVMALIASCGFYAVAGVVIMRSMNGIQIPPESMQLVTMVLGTVSAGFTTALSYYLGSSASSARKDEAK